MTTITECRLFFLLEKKRKKKQNSTKKHIHSPFHLIELNFIRSAAFLGAFEISFFKQNNKFCLFYFISWNQHCSIVSFFIQLIQATVLLSKNILPFSAVFWTCHNRMIYHSITNSHIEWQKQTKFLAHQSETIVPFFSLSASLPLFLPLLTKQLFVMTWLVVNLWYNGHFFFAHSPYFKYQNRK